MEVQLKGVHKLSKREIINGFIAIDVVLMLVYEITPRRFPLNSKFLIITIFKDNFSSLIETLSSISMLDVGVRVILKNGGEKLSEEQRIMVNSLLNSSNFEIKLLEFADSGIYSAMNQALQYSKSKGYLISSEWVWFLNSGDTLRTFLPYELELLDNVPNTSLIACGYPTRGLHLKVNETLQINTYEFLKGSIAISHQAALFRPSVFHQFGLYDDKKRIVSDFILMHKILCSSTLSRTAFPSINHEPFGISQTRLIRQEFEKILYVAQIAQESHNMKIIRIVLVKIMNLAKHIVKRALARFQEKFSQKRP